jgi:class 3 adenylate cyclase/pimeloyl-ACP methyl ester carboxylesterase
VETPSVQFARTTDDVSIAYTSFGAGADAVVQIMFPPFTDVAAVIPFLTEPTNRVLYERLYGGRRVVVVDPRGCGSSDKHAHDTSLAAYVRDVRAVVSACSISSLVFEAVGAAGPIGLAFAAEAPTTLKGLVLHDAWASGDSFIRPHDQRGLLALAEADTDTFAQTLGRMMLGWREPPPISLVDVIKAAAADKPALLRAVHSLAALDAMGLVSSVHVPTVVGWERGGSTLINGEGMRDIAARLSHATLLITDAAADGNPNDEWIAHIRGFVDSVLPHPKPSVMVPNGAPLLVILFTDLEGHTAVMSRLGDAKGRDVLREHERLTREALREHGGTEVKSMGDGFMASFGSAQKALECAQAIQRAFAEAVGGEALKVRIGVNAGEPVAEDDDLFGTSVIAAARIAAKANGGQVFVADVVRQLVAGKGFLFSDTGEHVLKGLEDPVRLWELRWV